VNARPHLRSVTSIDPEEAAAEQLLISALLDTGHYTPHSYGVPDDAITAFRPVHIFCTQYQAAEGEAPPPELVTSRFPSYAHVDGIGPTWAAKEVMDCHNSRLIRRGLRKASDDVAVGKLGQAVTEMRELANTIQVGLKEPASITDVHLLEQAAFTTSAPVPPGALADLTGGHGAGQLWFMAARWGTGKTWKLLEHAVHAAEGGWDVIIFSMEMQPANVIDRLHHIALRGADKPVAFMTLPERAEAMGHWQAAAGKINVYGPADGRVDAATVASAIKGDKTLVCLDYVNLMYTNSGHSASEDHNQQAQIGRELQEVAGYHATPMLIAAQLNRKGELAASTWLDYVSDLTLEYSIESSACNRIRKNKIVKYRHGEVISPWYSEFHPDTGKFGDISDQTAYAWRMEDEAVELSRP
jgi:hypothetical protein